MVNGYELIMDDYFELSKMLNPHQNYNSNKDSFKETNSATNM
jgi:hypothetical protein